MHHTYSPEVGNTTLVEVRILNLQRRSKWITSPANSNEPGVSKKVKLNVWSGVTAAGHRVHIVYRLGLLSIDIEVEHTQGGRKLRQQIPVMRWSPRFALKTLQFYQKEKAKSERAARKRKGAEPLSEKVKRIKGVRSMFRQKVQEFKVQEDALCQREARAENDKPWFISQQQLNEWLRQHHLNLKSLQKIQMEGSKATFRLGMNHFNDSGSGPMI